MRDFRTVAWSSRSGPSRVPGRATPSSVGRAAGRARDPGGTPLGARARTRPSMPGPRNSIYARQPGTTATISPRRSRPSGSCCVRSARTSSSSARPSTPTRARPSPRASATSSRRRRCRPPCGPGSPPSTTPSMSNAPSSNDSATAPIRPARAARPGAAGGGMSGGPLPVALVAAQARGPADAGEPRRGRARARGAGDHARGTRGSAEAGGDHGGDRPRRLFPQGRARIAPQRGPAADVVARSGDPRFRGPGPGLCLGLERRRRRPRQWPAAADRRRRIDASAGFRGDPKRTGTGERRIGTGFASSGKRRGATAAEGRCCCSATERSGDFATAERFVAAAARPRQLGVRRNLLQRNRQRRRRVRQRCARRGTAAPGQFEIRTKYVCQEPIGFYDPTPKRGLGWAS